MVLFPDPGGTFPGSGGAGNADYPGIGVMRELAEELLVAGRFIFDKRDGPGQSPGIAIFDVIQ